MKKSIYLLKQRAGDIEKITPPTIFFSAWVTPLLAVPRQAILAVR
jgi:hypothetical protein